MRISKILIIVLFLIGIGLIIISIWKLLPMKFLDNIPFFIIQTKIDPTNGISDSDINFIRVSKTGGSMPLFNPDGKSLYFVDSSKDLVTVNLDEVYEEVYLLDASFLSNFSINNEGNLIIAENFVSTESLPSVELIDLTKKKIITISENAWGGSWSPDFSHLVYIKRIDNNQKLQQVNVRSKKEIILSDLDDQLFPTQVSFSKLGNRLLVQSELEVSIYSIINSTAILNNSIPWAKNATWSPDGWHIIYTIDHEDKPSIWSSDIDGNNQMKLFEGVFSEINWLPDNRIIFFTPGKEGGASCWALDPRSGAQELLVDSSTVIWKPVDHIAVSPQGNALAFEAQDGQIWLLRIIN